MRILEQLGDQPIDMRLPQPASDEDILRAHDPNDLNRLQNGELSDKEARRVGLPWSPEIVRRAHYSAGADPYRHDRFGCLALTKKGLAERDCIVFQSCLETAPTIWLIQVEAASSRDAGYSNFFISTQLQFILLINRPSLFFCISSPFHRNDPLFQLNLYQSGYAACRHFSSTTDNRQLTTYIEHFSSIR